MPLSSFTGSYVQLDNIAAAYMGRADIAVGWKENATDGTSVSYTAVSDSTLLGGVGVLIMLKLPGPTVSVWDGTTEITGCTVSVWDGTTETPCTLEVAP